METKKNIIWLASYPKSGNTWFRVFLTNLLRKNNAPANINDLNEATISSSRKTFDYYTGLLSSELTFEEIDRLRPEVYRMQSFETDELLFKKVHDMFLLLDDNTPLFPPEISKGVVYIIRNPLDVLVSFAFHNNVPVKKMVSVINNHNYAFCADQMKFSNQLRQVLGSWSDHVKSWTGQKLIPVHVIRYEDMVSCPVQTFSEAVRFIGFKKTQKEIQNAVAKSGFNILQEQEKLNGFNEKMPQTGSFFRKGQVGDWKNHLDGLDTKWVVENHEEMMVKYKYIDDNRKLLV